MTQVADIAPLLPLLTLLFGSLVVVLMESFASSFTRGYGAYVVLLTLACTALAVYSAPMPNDQSLLRDWILFDRQAYLFMTLFLAIGAVVTLLSIPFPQETTAGEYFFLLLAALFGLMLITIAADFLTLFIGIETLSIALYLLVGYYKHSPYAGEAAIKYFFLGALGAAFLLYGIALLYGSLGTLRFSLLLERYQALEEASGKALFFGGIALVMVGLFFKAAVVPFHSWAPDVYEGASTPVTAFMATGTKVGAFAALSRLVFVTLPVLQPLWAEAFVLVALLTLLYAHYLALCQQQLRRFFAYSGIAHSGFLLIPIAVGTEQAFSALFFYLVVYVVATLGSFTALVALRVNQMVDLRGLFYRSPWMVVFFSFCLLTLAGIPPTVGFLGKFYLFKVALEAGFYTVVVMGLLMAVLAAYFYLRLIAFLFAREEGRLVPAYGWGVVLGGCIVFSCITLFSLYPNILL